MALDLIFTAILALMVALGAWRGAVIAGSGLVSLIVGYGGAILAATTCADWVASTLVVSPLVAPAVAGTLGFVVCWLVSSSLSDVLVAWDASRIELGGRALLDRAFGGFFGLARGGLIVVLLAILASWLDAARDLGAVQGLASMPEAESSVLAQASGDLMEAAVSSALADAGPAGDIAARIAARPSQTLGSVQTVLEDPRLAGMFEDAFFWTLIQNGSIDHAMNRGAVRSIVNDAEMRGRFVDLGLVEEAAREDPRVFRETMAGVLSEIAPRIARLHEDPELAELARDSEIIELVQAGDTLALMGHPRIRKIVGRLSSDL
ncbi:MAG: hypothetical protein CL908_21390 [Deltaproteobacteria bacterium]|jgi:uncharacterized membrane protein required for colicin V production|nr:hypothetical protein [Deltaproteobacteria bacterium]